MVLLIKPLILLPKRYILMNMNKNNLQLFRMSFSTNSMNSRTSPSPSLNLMFWMWMMNGMIVLELNFVTRTHDFVL